MWIQNDNKAVKRHYNHDVLGDLVDDPVEDLPGDERGVCWDGPIQVTEEIGQALVAAYDNIRPYKAGENE